MKYKLLTLDLDGTLLMPDLKIAAETVEALKKIIKNGAYVTLSTGRAFPTAKMYADELGIKTPVLSYNGAVIRSTQDNSYSCVRAMPLQKMEYIINYCKERGYYVQYYNDDKVIIEKATEKALRDPDLTICGYVEVGDFLKYKRKVSPKMLLVDTPERGELIMEDLKNKVGDIIYVARSAKHMVELMDKGVSKGSALEILCSHLGIKTEEAVSCGDSINDMEIIMKAGVGAAMANSSEELKKSADYVCSQSFSYGVLEVVEKYFKEYL